MQTKESFSLLMNDFSKAINDAQGKMDGRTFWPGSGGQLSASYIAIDANDILQKMSGLEIEKTNFKELFKTPAKIRYVLTGNYIIGLKVLVRDKKISKEESINAVKSFFYALEKLVDSDPFCLKGKNLVYNKKQLKQKLSQISFQKADDQIKKSLPRLSVSLDSLIWSEYYDIFIDAGINVHGPYTLADGNILLIKDYFDLKPVEIWDSVKEFPFKSVKLFLKFKPIDLTIDYLMHETSTQALAPNLLEWHAEAFDEKGKSFLLQSDSFEELTAKTMQVSSKQVEYVNGLVLLDKIKKGAELCYYQLKEFREFFGKKWFPPKEVFDIIEERGLERWEKFDWKNKQKQHSATVDWAKRYDPREGL
jgi:hypothetical protein